MFNVGMQSFDFRKIPWFWYFIALIVVVFDLTTKEIMINYFNDIEGARQNIMPLFDLTLVYNHGAAFGMFGGKRWPLAILAGVMSIILVVWLYRLPPEKRYEKVGLALILGGAIGNLYDRLVAGKVTDFLLVYINEELKWPAFNVADVAICVGAACLLFEAFKPSKSKSGKTG